MAIGVPYGVIGVGIGVAALHPARNIARSAETIAMVMNVFFIFFTFPLWFRVYCARNKHENASIDWKTFLCGNDVQA